MNIILTAPDLSTIVSSLADIPMHIDESVLFLIAVPTLSGIPGYLMSASHSAEKSKKIILIAGSVVSLIAVIAGFFILTLH
jgi:hypothetical protein